ncbi:YeeE/YedE family protein [Oceanimonas baumannii]|uniref:YeeE/YedE family protein n=1 Tax=Oceanimonas baumannii TaxID=129578 RepID=UPI001D180FB7|nr:YeeE/YedE family protein [Oceanimonas baumannii]MCC4262951.1 YeeE/YedE family protein [Oceanimonas baumannii]
MSIVNFTPLSALAGGVLIGVAALLLLLVGGRIAGISGIVAGIGSRSDKGWRLAFTAGLIAVPFGVFTLNLAEAYSLQDYSPWRLIIAGLLVGIGTRLGNGCTSGHGICGMGRLSPRSIVATLIFMAAGIATVTLSGWGG